MSWKGIFSKAIILAALIDAPVKGAVIMTTRGPIDRDAAGFILPHEHIFTDLRGPEVKGHGVADEAEVVRVMKPLLMEAKASGINTLIECTTIGVGRNVPIVARLARESGLNIVVPTGVYGRANFAPKAYAERSEDELARWMMMEIVLGIEGTGVKAGFIKTAASEEQLKPLEEKFLRAAARASKQTGVAIASHTTSGKVAAHQVEILDQLSVERNRFIWVHAQAEPDPFYHKLLAQRGAYIELDSVGSSKQEDEKIIKLIRMMVDAGFENQILLSHDAGWYNPGQRNGGRQRGYTALAREFVPRLKAAGLSDELISKMTRENPFRAFSLNSLKEQN